MKDELDDFVVNASYDGFDQEYEEMQELLDELRKEMTDELTN